MTADNLFTASGLADKAPRPLADRIRPQALHDIVGQDHLLGSDGAITHMLATAHWPSMILWGPPGVGKTTIARLVARASGLHPEALSAVFAGVKDLKPVFDAAKKRHESGQGTVLFIDEIHRFNRAQQDGFLPHVETGRIMLVGATTENPGFELNGALLSRCRVLVLNRLDEDAAEKLLARAETLMQRALPLSRDARRALIAMADGDGRHLLNLVEQVFTLAKDRQTVTTEHLATILHKRTPAYDKNRDEHYNLVSALHKSVRGSDPDAALYWLARMLAGGEDPLYIARRLIRMASEDIGLADTSALTITGEAARTFERLGAPEGELALAHAVIHLATAAKSNTVYTAWKAARTAADRTGSRPPPKSILNAPTAFMKAQGYGQNYQYDHDVDGGFSGQDYFPDGMKERVFYQPKEAGDEGPVAARLRAWRQKRKKDTPAS